MAQTILFVSRLLPGLCWHREGNAKKEGTWLSSGSLTKKCFSLVRCRLGWRRKRHISLSTYDHCRRVYLWPIGSQREESIGTSVPHHFIYVLFGLITGWYCIPVWKHSFPLECPATWRLSLKTSYEIGAFPFVPSPQFLVFSCVVPRIGIPQHDSFQMW